ncbi:MAG: hypothetical protein RBJ76_27925 [Stenomitos frigidus ULC029]
MSNKPDNNLGLATGLKYWLVFMVGLAVLGYTPFLSITFGALGGIASGVIAAWLKPKETYVPTPVERQAKEDEEAKEGTTAIAPAPRARFRKYGTPGARRQQQARGSRNFGWLFRKRSQ